MLLLSRLHDLIAHQSPGQTLMPDHERDALLSTAALLVLVTKVDGRLRPSELAGLSAFLGSRFGLTPEGVGEVLDEARAITEEADPATLAERILHDLRAPDRARLVALAYRMAILDGEVHEFEEDLIWRVARLLGIEEGDLAAIRRDALAA